MLLQVLCMHSGLPHPEFHYISHCRIQVRLLHLYMFPPSYASIHRHPIHRNRRVQSFSLKASFLRHQTTAETHPPLLFTTPVYSLIVKKLFGHTTKILPLYLSIIDNKKPATRMSFLIPDINTFFLLHTHFFSLLVYHVPILSCNPTVYTLCTVSTWGSVYICQQNSRFCR